MRSKLQRKFSPLVFLLLILSCLAWAQGSVVDGVLINAQDYFHDLEKKTVRLKGNVQLVFNGQHLSCDKATLDLKNGRVTAEGHVIIESDKIHIEGDKIFFNYRDNTGFIYNGFVKSGQVVFDGEVVEKVGENRFLASNAAYTACETCPPGWSFSGRKIDAEIGGYARIQRPVFRIAGVPVLMLPSIIVPLKSARQSGVLVPTADFSKKDGIGVSASYFWAINRSQDLTLTAQYYKERGYKTLGDYRYVLTNDSHGQLRGGFLAQDKQMKNEPYNITDNPDRWFLTYDHYYELPDNYVQRANINQISDLRYTRDFPDEIKGHGDSALENEVSLTKTTENQYASAEVDVYYNLLKTYPFQPNDDAVHRFPELRYSVKEQRLFDNGPLVRLDVNYVNFARGKWGYDDLSAAKTPLNLGPHGEIQRDGKFDPITDTWRTGQRLDLQPAISMPFQLWKKFDIMPSVLFRETQYRFDISRPVDEAGGFSGTAARRYMQTDIKAKTEFSRVFGDLSDPQGLRWKHSIEPEIGYSHIPWMRTPNHPFFGNFKGLKYSRQFDPVSDSDIKSINTGIQFDYNDRTFERRLINYALTNRITRKFWKDGTPDYKTVVLFRVGQFYDFNEAQSGSTAHDAHPWSSIDSLLDVRMDHFETYTVSSYNPYAHRNNIFTRLRGMLTPKNFLEVSYTENVIINNDDEVVPNSETRNYGVGAGVVTKYFDLGGSIDYSDITHKIQSWSYVLNIRPPGRCWVIHVEHVQNLGGSPKIKASLSFDFGGETVTQANTRSQQL